MYIQHNSINNVIFFYKNTHKLVSDFEALMVKGFSLAVTRVINRQPAYKIIHKAKAVCSRFPENNFNIGTA